jgi:hypothetical protein
VITHGRLSRPRSRAELPRDAIGLMMTGIGMIEPEHGHAH